MIQLTSKQAAILYQSNIWKDWTNLDIVKFQLFQKHIILPFYIFRQAVNLILPKTVDESGFNLNLLREKFLELNPDFSPVENIDLIPKEILGGLELV